MQATVDISRALPITGWMSPGELLWLANAAIKHPLIVEFGSYYGRSTRALGDNCKGRVWAVDPWNGEYPNVIGNAIVEINTFCYPQFCKNLGDLISSGRVVPHRGFSWGFHLPYQVDMVFIDGDHRYETVLRDIDKAFELLRPGGLISGHDYSWDTVRQAVTVKLGQVEVMETIWFKTKL
jgi:hypothetical protein